MAGSAANVDEPVKSRKTATAVMPANPGPRIKYGASGTGAGIQKYQRVTKHWTPAFAGETTFYGGINVEQAAILIGAPTKVFP